MVGVQKKAALSRNFWARSNPQKSQVETFYVSVKRKRKKTKRFLTFLKTAVFQNHSLTRGPPLPCLPTPCPQLWLAEYVEKRISELWRVIIFCPIKMMKMIMTHVEVYYTQSELVKKNLEVCKQIYTKMLILIACMQLYDQLN